MGVPQTPRTKSEPAKEQGLGIQEQPLPWAPASVSPEVQCTLVQSRPWKVSGLLNPVLSLYASCSTSLSPSLSFINRNILARPQIFENRISSKAPVASKNTQQSFTIKREVSLIVEDVWSKPSVSSGKEGRRTLWEGRTAETGLGRPGEPREGGCRCRGGKGKNGLLASRRRS